MLNFLTGKRQYDADTALVEVTYELRRVAAIYARTWLALDVVSCLPLECIVSAAGVHGTYHTTHLNRCTDSMRGGGGCCCCCCISCGCFLNDDTARGSASMLPCCRMLLPAGC